jgi:N-acetylglucosamine-6-phosphate deacetylase
MTVQVANGRAMAGGVLAGSVLTLNRALENFLAFTGASMDEALPLLTRNPAAMTGLGGAGALTVGRAADVVVLGSDGQLQACFVGGKLAE